LFLLIFCFDYIPYQFIVHSNYRHLVEWDNALKELALSGGAFVIAGYSQGENKNILTPPWTKLINYGPLLFSIPIICFGILHFLYAKEVSSLIPAWIPGPVLWAYLAGAGLLGSGVAITFKIKPGIMAIFLGTMILIWFIILHLPRVIAAPADEIGGEITSAFLALAYSGIAFVIANSTFILTGKRLYGSMDENVSDNKSVTGSV
jgi:hypothetical protein